jgi:dynein heavy chain
LRRTENKTLKVNFDPMIVRLLREVKYLLLMDIAIPANALEIYQKVDIYRNQTTKLDIIVDMYNTIVTTLNRVEEPMLREKINKMDDILQPGITD